VTIADPVVVVEQGGPGAALGEWSGGHGKFLSRRSLRPGGTGLLDHGQRVVPARDEGLGALRLQLRGECLDVDAGCGEPRERLLGVPAVGRQRIADLTVIGERPQVSPGIVSTVNGASESNSAR
jgi:hypothetical protein